MNHQLKAVYNAIAETNCHGAFYRLPGSGKISAIISDEFENLTDSGEGFIIHPYAVFEKTKLISRKISFDFNDTGVSYMINEKSELLNALIDHYRKYNKTETEQLPEGNDIVDTEKEYYIQCVESTVQKIREGTFKKAVLSRIKKTKPGSGIHSIDLFQSLCDEYPGAFVSLITSAETGTWLGASPEVLLQQDENKFSTIALAGTRKTIGGASFSDKEEKEQEIIVQAIGEMLERKKISYETSSVTERNTGLLNHLETTISFESNPLERFRFMEQLHPTPAVGGYPKYEALKWIDKTEKHQRELYAGYVGVVDSNKMHIYVNIRCMQRFKSFDIQYAGAGITAESIPEKEWEETESKLNVLGAVLERGSVE